MSAYTRESWGVQEFDNARLWDRRCVASVAQMGEKLASNMGDSFSAACGESLRQSASTIFSRDTVTVESIQHGHYEQTAQRSSLHGRVIVAQDTTFANYTTHGSTRGLGPIDCRGKSHGLVIHSGFAVTAQGLPLGLVGQEIWARDTKRLGQRHSRRSRSITEKESNKWLKGLDWVNARLAPHVGEICVVADRESDVFEYMVHPRAENVSLVLRATHPRKVLVAGQNEPTDLKTAVENLPVVGRKKVVIERAKVSVEITLELAVGRIEVRAPRHLPKSRSSSVAPMSVVRAREVDSTVPEPLEWVLLCSAEVADFEAASRCIDDYTERWKIERLHYTLKSGLRIEDLQFDTAKKLSNAIGLCSVVAWKVMWLTYSARTNPDAPAETVLSEQELQVLQAAAKKPVATVGQAVEAVAKLGGFLRSSGRYKNPGVKSIWRGWMKLQLMAEGWRLLAAKDKLQG